MVPQALWCLMKKKISADNNYDVIEAARRFEAALRGARIAEMAEKAPRTLSGGAELQA
jgi:energy-coupling factor transporter ATP-binding protein EcfA2